MTMFQSIERHSGEIVFFDKSKLEGDIKDLLAKVKTEASNSYLVILAAVIAEKTIQYLDDSFKDALTSMPKEEDLKRALEQVLMQLGEYDAARYFIRRQYEKTEFTKKRDYDDFIQELIEEDSIGRESFDYNQLSNALIEQAAFRYWTTRQWSSDVVRKLEMGIFEMPEAYTLTPRWIALSVEQLLLNGQYIKNGERLGAPLTLSAVLSQFMTMLTQLRREASYVLCINHFDTWLAPYVREGELSFGQVKEHMQNFIHQLVAAGVDMQGANQFVIRLDKEVPKTFINRQVIFEGKTHPLDIYGSYQYEMDMINRSICEILSELHTDKIDAAHISWRYQVDEHWDWKALISDRILETAVNTKWLSFEKLAQMEAYWMGSYGLCQVNLERIGKLASSMEELVSLLESSIEAAIYALSQRRDFIEKLTHMRFYSIQNAYRTSCETQSDGETEWTAELKFDGLDECIQHFTKGSDSLDTTAGQAFGEEIEELIGEFVERFQKQYRLNLRIKPNSCRVSLKSLKEHDSANALDEALYGDCAKGGIALAGQGIERLSIIWELPEDLEHISLVRKLLMYSFKNKPITTCSFA